MVNDFPLWTTHEQTCFDKNKHFHKDTFIFLKDIYEFSHKIKLHFVGTVTTKNTLQLMHLAKLSGCIRAIHLSIAFGYPEQAGVLCASIWELSQTIIYFSANHDATQHYLDNTNNKSKMPSALKPEGKRTNWKEICEENVKFLNDQTNSEAFTTEKEYSVYQDLCQIKHFSPEHVNQLKKYEDGSEIPWPPLDYEDKRLNIPKMCRQILLALETIIKESQDNELRKKLSDLRGVFTELCQIQETV